MPGLDQPQKSAEAGKSEFPSSHQSFRLESGIRTPSLRKTEPDFLLLDSPYSPKYSGSTGDTRTTPLSKAASERAVKPSGSSGSGSDGSKPVEKPTLDPLKSKSPSPPDAPRQAETPSKPIWETLPMSELLKSLGGSENKQNPKSDLRPDSRQPLPGERRREPFEQPPAVRDNPFKPRIDRPAELSPAREYNLAKFERNKDIPDAKIYAPAGFDPSKPVNVIIYNHGWRDTASSAFQNANLRRQMAAAPENSLLIIPAWQIDEGAETSVESQRFAKNFLPMFRSALRHQGTDLSNVGSINIISHSAGGVPLERELSALRGTPLYDRVKAVTMLDTNYSGRQPAVDSWIAHNLRNGKFASGDAAFYNLYAGGTDSYSRSQAARIARMVNNPSINPHRDLQLLDSIGAPGRGRTSRVQDVSGLPIVFQNTADAHGNFPKKYFAHALNRIRR